jgi:hypothetical protein
VKIAEMQNEPVSLWEMAPVAKMDGHMRLFPQKIDVF